MTAYLWTISMSVALGAFPGTCSTCSTGMNAPVYNAAPAYSGGMVVDGYAGGGAYGAEMYGGTNGRDPLFPFDGQEPWLHGYFQEMSPYGSYNYYRPYNYRNVFAQSRTAAAWGMPANMPYSQQFWHRYKAQAAMRRPVQHTSPYDYNEEKLNTQNGNPSVPYQSYVQNGNAAPVYGQAYPVGYPAAGAPTSNYAQQTGYQQRPGELEQRLQGLQNAIQMGGPNMNGPVINPYNR